MLSSLKKPQKLSSANNHVWLPTLLVKGFGLYLERYTTNVVNQDQTVSIAYNSLSDWPELIFNFEFHSLDSLITALYV